MQDTLVSKLYDKAKHCSLEDDEISEHLDDLLKAFLIRQVELKFLELFSNAKISGTVHTCVGQELTGVILSKYLQKNDWVTSNHRCHGHYISRTNDWQGLIRELVGLKSGVSKGIGSSQHLFRDKFISNGTQGSLLPVACGIGLSMKRRNTSGIAVSFIGEGTLGEGVVYETLNLGAVFQSPHLIICENNYYSQSTPQSSAVAGNINDRAKAFGWTVFDSNTWDLNHLNKIMKEAVDHVRMLKGPAFLKVDTYRLCAHSKGDDDRSKDEVEKFSQIDLVSRLIELGEYDVKLNEINSEINNFLKTINMSSEKINYDEYKIDQLPRKLSLKVKKIKNDQVMMVKALSRSYRSFIENNDAVFIGEDIADPYGGAFKVTQGFQSSHPHNIYSTPISEAGLVGLAIGMDLDGCNSFAEIMFGDFIVNSMDQIINNASKFHHMYGKQISCGVTIRTPMGGRRGYGPTHSQSLEKFLLGIDNTLVAAVTSLCDPHDLLTNLNNVNCPKIVIENKTDYSSPLYNVGNEFLFEKVGGPLGTIRLTPVGATPSLLVVTYGYLGRLIADNYFKIFRETDCVFTLVNPQLLHPIPFGHFEKLATNIKRVLVIEESSAGFGWADGIAAMISELKDKIQVSRLSADPVAIPSNREIEEYNIVSVKKIIDAIRAMDRSYD